MEKWKRGSLRTALAASFVLLALCGALLCARARTGSAIVDRALGPLMQYALPAGQRIIFEVACCNGWPRGHTPTY